MNSPTPTQKWNFDDNIRMHTRKDFPSCDFIYDLLTNANNQPPSDSYIYRVQYVM